MCPCPFSVVLGLCCCGGFSLVAVCRLPTAVSSLVVGHGLLASWISVVTALGFSTVVEQYCLLFSVRTYNLDDKGG